MNESVKKLIRELEPLIVDLDDAMIELRIKQEEFERVSRFLAYVNSDVHMVGIYADQNFILENLDKVNGTKDKYKASCYLLKNEEDGVKALPQYQEANDYMLRLINYFKTNKMELANIIQKLDNKCKEKSLNKKYYELFNRENPLIEDLGEFSEFLNKYVTESDDKIDILTYVINNNLLNYKGIKS